MKRAGKYWVPDCETIQTDALAKGGWQLGHLETALLHVDKFRCAVDGGAHIGSWTLAMAERFNAVHAFEPCLETFDCLARNAIGKKNILLHQIALGHATGSAAMAEDGKYSNGGNTGGRYLVPGDEVSVTTLDSLRLTVDFLKLDVEGYELYALQGAEKTIRRSKPVIMIEVKHRIASRQGLRAEEAGEFLSSLGMYPVDQIGSDHIWKFAP